MTFLDLMATIQGFGISVTLFGVPFLFSFWTIALAAMVSLAARTYIAKQMREHPGTSHTIAGIGAAITVIVCILAHEAAHSYTGWLLGLATKSGGLSWWGAYVAFDHNLNEIPPLYEVAIALAGPLTNLALAGIGVLLVSLLRESHLENALQYNTIINYRLGLLNLVPVIGLDGSKALDGLLRPFVSASVIGYILTFTTIFAIDWYFRNRKKAEPSAFEQLVERI